MKQTIRRARGRVHALVQRLVRTILRVLHRAKWRRPGTVGHLLTFYWKNDVLGHEIASLPAATLGRLFHRSRASRNVLLQTVDPAVPVEELLDACDHPELIPLVTRLIVLSRQEEARSQLLYQTLVLSRVEAGPHRVRCALRVVTRSAPTLSSNHARSVLNVCFILSGAPVNPYERPGLSEEARIAGAALLQHHPELDAVVTTRVKASATENVLSILAASLRLRSLDRDVVFVAGLEAWRPSLEEAQTFALDCDSRYSAADPVYTPPSQRVRAPRARWVLAAFARLLGALLVGPSVVLLGAILVHEGIWRLPQLGIGLGESLGALALLVAVNVVSAELSASRLPGPLAKYTSTPVALVAGYSVALSILSLVLTKPSGKWWASALNGLAVPFLGFGVLVVVVMSALVRRTDPADAAARFERTRRAATVRAGHRLGRIQTQTRSLRRKAAQLPSVRLQTTISVGERRSTLRAVRRGFHLPSASRLARLAGKEPWRSGRLTLVLAARLGTISSAGDELAAIVPSPDATVTARQYRSVARLVKPRRVSIVDQSAEAVAVLLDLQLGFARRHDESGASRVARVLGDFVSFHLQGVRSGRATDDEDDEVLPVVPALRTLVAGLCGVLAGPAKELELESFTELLNRVVSMGDRRDAVIPMLCSKVDDLVKDAELESIGAEALRHAGIRALESNDKLGAKSVMWAMEGNLVGNKGGDVRQWLLEAMSQFAASGVLIDYFSATTLFDWYWDATGKIDKKVARLLGAMRIGAASLLAGNMSVALRSAVALRDAGYDLQKLEDFVQHRERVSREQSVSDISGGYLGPDAEASLRRFARFAQGYRAALAGADDQGS